MGENKKPLNWGETSPPVEAAEAYKVAGGTNHISVYIPRVLPHFVVADLVLLFLFSHHKFQFTLLFSLYLLPQFINQYR